MALISHLTKEDLGRWLEALVVQPSDSDELLAWITGPLREFFPFERVFVAYGEFVAGQAQITHWQQSGFPQSYMQQLATTFEIDQRGLLVWWLMNRQPFFFDPLDPLPHATDFELEEIKNFSLGRLGAHGVLNLKASAGTHFVFCGLSDAPAGWHLDALRVMAPVLNDLLLAYVHSHEAAPLSLQALTARQADIVRLVATGIDDKTIARSLGIAQKTVRNQLTQIYTQLGIHKRAQLIAMLR